MPSPPLRARAAGDSLPPLTGTSRIPTQTVRSLRRRRVAPHLLAALAVGAAVVIAVGHPAPGRPPRRAAGALDAALVGREGLSADEAEPRTLAEQRRRLFARMRSELALSDAQMAKVEAIFAASWVLGQGNPAITQHPMSRSECRSIQSDAGVVPARVPACGAPSMVPIFDPTQGQLAADAPVCIDQFEFPNIPCEYPVVHVTAREAALLCEAIGKRICDAHEWEGACAGALRDPRVEYAWGRSRRESAWLHNRAREKVWAYGPRKDHPLCATGSFRTPGCRGGGWNRCGSNTYPAGAFPRCQSPFGVFDLHGNAAEHMNLPTSPGEMAGIGGGGFTEMKGSWFIFSTIEAHEDDCRWRAPDWHGSRVMDRESHSNYHLGFRCCKDAGRP
jgi:hypothetical protein